ncbi:MAG: L,D-transpeptidase family protein [Sphingomonadaceae bacterium]|nr:L,D-transpeptidase family protein [Sphingomonadaceae bacterium]
MPAAAVAHEAALQAAVGANPELQRFYLPRSYRPLWIEGSALRPAAKSLLARLATAADDGLAPERYGLSKLATTIAAARSGDTSALIAAEVQLSSAYGAYLADLHRPSAAEAMTYVHEGLAPEPRTAAAWLQDAGRASSLETHLDASTRMNPIYSELRAGLAGYRAAWSSLPQTPVAAGPMLKVGATGPRVAALRERLGLPAAPASFDEALAAKLRAFQSAHGLPVDGAAGPRTVSVLNEGSVRYERLIHANLERARAIPANPGKRFIFVDVASATLRAYGDGKVEETMRVIVGKPDQKTPTMAARMSHAIVNPYWNLPPDLTQIRARRVLAQGPSYLSKDKLESMSGWEADARPLAASEIDWKAVASGAQILRMRQLPGPHNMMGKVKFMMPNNLGIYLHDTPTKGLFASADRRFSSGCVRLADAPRLARWLFGADAPDPAKMGMEQQVDLKESVPVYISYLTVEAKPDGSVAFRGDPYRRDASLLAALDRTSGSAAARGAN